MLLPYAEADFATTGDGNVFAGKKIVDKIVIEPDGTAGTLALKKGGSGGSTVFTFDLTTSKASIQMDFPNGWMVDTLYADFTTASGVVTAIVR